MPQVAPNFDEVSWPHRRNRSHGAPDDDTIDVLYPASLRYATPSPKSHITQPLPHHRHTPSPASFSRTGLLRSRWLASKTRSMSNAIPWSSSGAFWLTLYFVANLALTLYNKIVLIHFPFPYTLTALHALCGSVGTFVLLHWNPPSTSTWERIWDVFRRADSRRPSAFRFSRHPGALTVTPDHAHNNSLIPPVPSLRGREIVVLVLFSMLYTVNIVVSNASLRLVTIPFHQVVRASAPLFTILLSALLLGKYSSRAKLMSLIPVMAGVGFATYGDYYFTPRGFLLTLFGTVLAALKTITTNLLQKPPSNPENTVLPPLSPTSASFKFPPRLQSSFNLDEKTSERTGADPQSPIVDYEPPNEGYHHEKHDGAFQTEPLLQAFGPDATARSIALPAHSDPPCHNNPHTPSSWTSWTPSPPWPLPKLPKLPMLSLNLNLDLPKLSLTPLQLLYLLSPLAFIQTTLLAHFSGELERVSLHLSAAAEEYYYYQQQRHDGALGTMGGLGGTSGSGIGSGSGASAMAQVVGVGVGVPWTEVVRGAPRVWLLFNGVLAFLLNVVSFNANRKVGALGMSVAANVKQVLAVLCSLTLFNLTITPTNGVGIVLTLVGGAWYAAVELQEKKRRA